MSPDSETAGSFPAVVRHGVPCFEDYATARIQRAGETKMTHPVFYRHKWNTELANDPSFVDPEFHPLPAETPEIQP